MNEHFPSEIENRRKLLYPEAKQARQDKNNEVKLVRDKLFINGWQFIPNTIDTQTHNPRNNNNANYNILPKYRTPRRFDQRNDDRQQQINLQNNGTQRWQQQQVQTQPYVNRNQQKIGLILGQIHP